MKRESIIVLGLVLGLVLTGVFMVYSTGAADPHGMARFQRQLVYVAIGICALFLCANVDYHRLREPFWFRSIVLIALLLLALVLIPGIGEERKGAQRWIEVPGLTSFQPSELAKFALILLLAVKLAQNHEQMGKFFRGFLPPLVITGLFAGLVLLEDDLGTPVVMISVAFCMMFIAGARWRYLIPSMVPVALGIATLIVITPYRVKRLTTFLNPWKEREENGYQLIQSMVAFAQGGVFGKGPGRGEQKLHYLPDAHTDFIFAAWAEETGLIGTLMLAGMFLLLFAVILRIAANARDMYGALLAGGIAALVAIQAAINMAVTTGLVPTKGLPLPFVSWGGTALIVFMALMGLVISVGLQGFPPSPHYARVKA